jgi:CxxC motif-containing protein
MSGAGETGIICVACPIGCRMKVTGTGETFTVTGNRCPKGEAYGREEALSPRRVVTGVVRTDSALFPYAPVRTDAPLPRGLMQDLMAELASRTTGLPVRTGECMVRDFRATGVNVVFTRSLPPDEIPPVG